MKKLKLLIGAFFVIGISGCLEKSEKLRIQEIGGNAYLIENDSGNVYRIVGNNKILIEDLPSPDSIGQSKKILEEEFNLPNNLVVEGRFKLTRGRTDYILVLLDKGYEKLQSELTTDYAILTPVDDSQKKPSQTPEDFEQADENNSAERLAKLKEYESNGFKIIQMIANRTDSDSRFDRINLEFKDEDGFTLAQESVSFSGGNITRITGFEDEFIGLRVEGTLTDRSITPLEVSSINHTYNGFDLE